MMLRIPTPVVLHMPYSLSGTELGYALPRATACPVLSAGNVRAGESTSLSVSRSVSENFAVPRQVCTGLRACYAMPGTDLAVPYGPRRLVLGRTQVRPSLF
eukprot:571259-Rhodomonas_salina.1